VGIKRRATTTRWRPASRGYGCRVVYIVAAEKMVSARDDSPDEDPYNLTMRTTLQWQAGSIVDEIAEILRERIVEGRLAPQEPLTQRRVAEDLNVPRAVAGEALRMLHREGLVDSDAGTMRVAEADGAVLSSAYAVREVVDGLAARLAARHAGPGTERRCLAALEDHRAATETGNRLQSMRADISFHASLVDGSGNPVLRCHWLLVRFTTRSAMLLTPSQLQAGIEEHEAILAAVGRGEPEPAERAARAHVRVTIDALAQISLRNDRSQLARSP
jgi:DNA-binding GntR family transcriptional regulator